MALGQRLQGDVILQARVGKNGTAADVRQLKGNPLLGGATMAAVWQWRYQPSKQDGVPRDMETTVTLRFRIPERFWRID